MSSMRCPRFQFFCGIAVWWVMMTHTPWAWMAEALGDDEIAREYIYIYTCVIHVHAVTHGDAIYNAHVT